MSLDRCDDFRLGHAPIRKLENMIRKLGRALIRNSWKGEAVKLRSAFACRALMVGGVKKDLES